MGKRKKQARKFSKKKFRNSSEFEDAAPSSHSSKRKRDDIIKRELKARFEETSDVSHENMHVDSTRNTEEIYESQNRDCAFCNLHFASPEAARYHRMVKVKNEGARMIPFKDFKKNVHHVLCPKLDCCFSSSDPQKVKNHVAWFHKENLDGSYTVISELTQEEEKVSSHPCGICCKNFSNAGGLRNHVRTCKGKYLYSCPYCFEKYEEREDFTQHIVAEHRPETDFEKTGVFVGENRLKRKATVDRAVERSIVLMVPGLTTTDEVFTQKIKTEMIKLLRYDLGN